MPVKWGITHDYPEWDLNKQVNAMKHTPEIDEILAAVKKVIENKIFYRSPLMCAFLTYVTWETLQGRESRISAYSVAVDALDKPIDFDPQMDPSVRVLAKRLRDSLARYYDEVSDYGICIVLKPGSYVPSFYHTKPISLSALARGEASNSSDTSSPTSRLSWSAPVVSYHMIDTDQGKGISKNNNRA